MIDVPRERSHPQTCKSSYVSCPSSSSQLLLPSTLLHIRTASPSFPSFCFTEVGTTNRRRDDECTDPIAISPTRISSPPPYIPPDGRNSTVMHATASSLSKQNNGGRSNARSKERGKTKDVEKGTPLTILETMQCKFVESFEAGKNNVCTTSSISLLLLCPHPFSNYSIVAARRYISKQLA